MRTKVIVVDDHAIVFDGIRMIMRGNEDIVIDDIATSATAAFDLLESKHPDIVIVDVSLGGENGVQFMKDMHQRWPDIGILVFSMHSDANVIASALGAGALGYIHKSAAKEEIVEGITEVANNRTYLCKKTREIVVRDYAGKSMIDDTFAQPHLTDRELEVTRYLALGLTTKQVAEKLKISKNTVDTHRANIMEKLETRSLADVTRFAIRQGIVEEHEI